MRRLEDQLKWFIIDWEDAASAPASAEPHFERNTHSPVFLLKDIVQKWIYGVLEG
jgi:hypothetical protein